MSDADRPSRAQAAPAARAQPDEPLAGLRRRLTAAARRAAPRWLSDEIEDLVQNALIRVTANLENRDGGFEGVPSSYLARAAYSAVVDEMRRRFRRGEVQEDAVEGMDGMPSPDSGPERSFEAAEIHTGLRDCLARLIRPRRVVVACRLQGYSVPETAGLTGWTRKRVEHLVLRGMRDLRHCLEAKGLRPGRGGSRV